MESTLQVYTVCQHFRLFVKHTDKPQSVPYLCRCLRFFFALFWVWLCDCCTCDDAGNAGLPLVVAVAVLSLGLEVPVLLPVVMP